MVMGASSSDSHLPKDKYSGPSDESDSGQSNTHIESALSSTDKLGELIDFGDFDYWG